MKTLNFELKFSTLNFKLLTYLGLRQVLIKEFYKENNLLNLKISLYQKYGLY